MKKYIIVYIQIMAISILCSQEVFEGYTLFTPGGTGGGSSATTYLKDNDLNNIQTWSHSNGAASMPYLIPGAEPGLENTLLIYPYRVNNPTMDTGGVGGAFECLTWDGDFVWGHTISNTNYQHHHDVEPLPNGNVLMIAWENKISSEWQAAGRTYVDNPLNTMWSTAIFEIAHDGSGGGEIVWEWHLWDHLVQDADPNDDNYGVVSDHPELMDINCGDVGTFAGGPGGPTADWMHINAISYNAAFDQIVLSSRFQDEIYVIDHSTTTAEAATHSGGNSGKGGDFLYRWGNPQNYDRGNNADHNLGDQHSINWIPDDYPGEGNFILFNNGYNEACEFDPPMDEDGFYEIEDGQPYGPDACLWTSIDISTQMQGGAFRLPNGNTLLTDCDSADIKEVTEGGTTLWTYSHSGNNATIARAQKYAIDFFDGNDSILGDINGDDILNILDIVSLVNLVLGGGEYQEAADVNSDGILNILDIVSLVNLILNS